MNNVKPGWPAFFASWNLLVLILRIVAINFVRLYISIDPLPALRKKRELISAVCNSTFQIAEMSFALGKGDGRGIRDFFSFMSYW
jgi:hypothetical protein